VTGPRQGDTIHRALEVRIDGVPLFQTVQATWNLLEPSAASALRDAWRDGRGVIVKEVLANGRLTDRYGGRAVDRLRARARAAGTTVESLAVAAALAQPWAHVVLSGAVTPAQFEAQVAALAVREEDARKVPSIAQRPELYWNERAAIPWC
jgi:aryl-alcohol dehydrogenase-like predicted oxidoreductase